MDEIIFNGKSSYSDFDLIVNYFKPQPPAVRVIKETIPFANGCYDFSNIYGEQSYEERKILCKLQFVSKDKTLLYIKYSEILDWLIGSGQTKLEHTSETGVYYIAKVESAPSWNTFSILGEFEFEFIAYPFKYGKNNEGSDIWDEFNFEVDYAQDTKFNIVNSKTIELYNPSAIKIVPMLSCSAPIQILKENITYNFKAGTTKDWRFSLDKSKNNLELKGNGSIEFIFRKEVL